MKNFINQMSCQSQQEILKKVCSSERYSEVLAMAEDGYIITGDILELLYRLGHEDIVKKLFCQMPGSMSESARNFFINFYGKTAYESMKEIRRQQIIEQFDKLVNEQGLSPEVFKAARETGNYERLITRFGADAVCEAVKGNKFYYNDVEDLIPVECWCRHGVFIRLLRELCWLTNQGTPESDQKSIALLDKVGDIPGVVEFIWQHRNHFKTAVWTWLGQNHREIFFAEKNSQGYQFAFFYGNMTQKEWEEFYEFDQDRAVACAVKTSKYEWLWQKGLKWLAFKAALKTPLSHWFKKAS